MPCLVCGLDIPQHDNFAALQYAGDAEYERGRYAVHAHCMPSAWRKTWVTPAQLRGDDVVLYSEVPVALETPEPPSKLTQWRTSSKRSLARLLTWGAQRLQE